MMVFVSRIIKYNFPYIISQIGFKCTCRGNRFGQRSSTTFPETGQCVLATDYSYSRWSSNKLYGKDTSHVLIGSWAVKISRDTRGKYGLLFWIIPRARRTGTRDIKNFHLHEFLCVIDAFRKRKCHIIEYSLASNVRSYGNIKPLTRWSRCRSVNTAREEFAVTSCKTSISILILLSV